MKKGLLWVVVIVVAVALLWWVFGTGSSEIVVKDQGSESVENNTPEVSLSENEMEALVEFTVRAEDYSFSPVEMVVKKGQRVKIILVNVGGYHDLLIDEFRVDSGRINEGEEVSVEFMAGEVGEFEYYCSVGNHRAQGMVGTLVVEE